jgi:phosphatidate phosphatase APP1
VNMFTPSRERPKCNRSATFNPARRNTVTRKSGYSVSVSESSGITRKSPAPSHHAARMEDAWQAWRVRSGLRRKHAPTLIPFGGYGRPTWVRILARVVLVPQKKKNGHTTKSVRGWRSFISAPIPHGEVTISLGDQTFTVFADRGGVIDTRVTLHLTPGWNDVWLSVSGEPPVRCPVFVVDDETAIGVVCDIDDTVMVTALPRPFLAAWNSFVRDEHARRPVPGMAVLMERIIRDHPGSPVIYLSTGAWNVHPTLTRFLTRHLYPLGSLLLTDWGPTHDRWFRSGQQHKRENLTRLAAEFPHIKWILIGDDGQHDEDLYAEFARAHPDSVRAIAIRELLAPEALLAGGRSHHDRTHDPEQVPWVSAPNGAGLALELARVGVINTPAHAPQE